MGQVVPSSGALIEEIEDNMGCDAVSYDERHTTAQEVYRLYAVYYPYE